MRASRSLTFLVRISVAFGVLLCFLLLPVRATAIEPLPPLDRRVVDTTGTLPAATRQSLESTLAALQASTGAQLVVAVIPTTGEEDIAQYSIRLVEAWKIGQAKADNGVLLLVALKDRKMRIEVGRGLEGDIPDAVARRITAEVIAPEFKSGNYARGIELGVQALAKILTGNALPPQTHSNRSPPSQSDFSGLVAILLFGFVPMIQMSRSVFGRVPAAAVGALLAFLASILFLSLLVSLLISAAAFCIGLTIPTVPLVGSRGRRGIGYPGSGYYSGPSSGGFSSGDYSGGGFSGGGFDGGGGGFSGGGGEFGGGGASGSW